MTNLDSVLNGRIKAQTQVARRRLQPTQKFIVRESGGFIIKKRLRQLQEELKRSPNSKFLAAHRYCEYVPGGRHEAAAARFGNSPGNAKTKSREQMSD